MIIGPKRKYFLRVRINFRSAGKILFCWERLAEPKNYAKNFSKKIILCGLVCLNFKCKNNIKRKRLWVWQIFIERHSKGEFHVLVKELKLLYH